LQRRQQGRTGRYRMQIVERAHHVIKSRVRPSGALDPLDLMRSDHAGDLTLLFNNKTSLAGAKQMLVDEVLEIQPTFDGWAVARHHVGDAHILERLLKTNLHIAFPGRLQEKPANKGDPQTTEACAAKKFEYAEQNEGESDALTGSGRQMRGTIRIARFPPDDGAQDTAPVKGISRYEIESGEGEIYVSQPKQHGRYRT